MLIFVIGYMGAGKTTLGKMIATHLDYRFYDLDEMIEISTGYTISAYFEKNGETAFRKMEREILLNHIEDRNTVIAAGGGTACFEDNIELMNRSGITIFLDTGYQTVMKRLAEKYESRPLLKNIPPEKLPAFIREHMESRRRFYEKARICVKEETLDLELLVKDIVNLSARPSMS
ncbi:MAG: shikimate kinase [Bacteroidales bacterium]|nr:shikimate kinase [Bacteroidales bacterium]